MGEGDIAEMRGWTWLPPHPRTLTLRMPLRTLGPYPTHQRAEP
jgi:hypothetical protein